MTQITRGLNDSTLSWSPDGEWITVINYDDKTGWDRVYLIHYTGHSEHFLSNWNNCHEGHPEWSPDSRWVIFTCTDGGIHHINIDGTNLYQIMKTDSYPPFIDLSPNGEWMIFNWSMMNISSHEVYPLPFNYGLVYDNIGWTPDSQWILFAEGDDPEKRRFYKVRPEGTDLQSTQIISPSSWSPDGHLLVSESNGATFLADTNGANPQLFTYPAEKPQWSPDGKWIAFIRRDADSAKLYRLQPDKSDLQRLDSAKHDVTSFAWSPKWVGMSFHGILLMMFSTLTIGILILGHCIRSY